MYDNDIIGKIIIDEDDVIEHYGRPHEGYTPHSGRYEWGSGENAYQRSGGFLKRCDDLKKEGLSEKEIAEYFNMTTSQLRAKKSQDAAKDTQARYNAVYAVYDGGITSPTAIAKKLGMPNSTVTSILKKRNSAPHQIQNNTLDALKRAVDEYGYVDVGKGVNRYMGITEDRLKKSCVLLRDEEGYTLEQMTFRQATTNHSTQVKILAKPGTTRAELMEHQTDWHPPFEYTQDGGLTFQHREPVVNIDNKRVMVRYPDEGGKARDGTIELRRGVEDLSLGKNHYAQVRIGMENPEDPSKPLYLKGMAIYGDDKDFPPGVDIIFNTGKKRGTPYDGVFKPQTNDPDNPFGASLKDDEKMKYMGRTYTGKDGKEHQSALNVVKEEGDVGSWTKAVASQVLSKQDPKLAKKQLAIAGDIKEEEFEELSKLTNPVVKSKLLRSFADECDSAAVELKAAAFPRQTSNFILPFPEMANDEIYAPHYKNGEEVILIRYPHGGIFEIPRLRVNNNVKRAKETLGNAKDAVGINSTVAEQLSGADFDGDTVLVIPTKGNNWKTKKPYKELLEFNNKDYKITDFEEGATSYNGHKVYTNKQGHPTLARNQSCGNEMGVITNLITDMTLKGASDDELVRAVKHSQVIIDAYKHGLDYYKSYEDFGIRALKKKYQQDPDTGKSGAGTIISRAKSKEVVPVRRQYYKVDPETGEKIWPSVPEKDKYYNKPTGKIDPATGKQIWKKVERTMDSTKMYETSDAYTLVSKNPAPVELVYADYANRMKALGNKARLLSENTGKLPENPNAKKVYAAEVQSLKDKLNIAEKNAPLERQAQLLCQKKFEMKRNDNGDLYDDYDQIKKVKNVLIAEARATVGAKKEQIVVTDKEWEAIQAGAVGKTVLEEIVKNSDEKRLKELSMPREKKELSASTITKIQQLDKQGYTLNEIAEYMGMSSESIADVI